MSTPAFSWVISNLGDVFGVFTGLLCSRITSDATSATSTVSAGSSSSASNLNGFLIDVFGLSAITASVSFLTYTSKYSMFGVCVAFSPEL